MGGDLRLIATATSTGAPKYQAIVRTECLLLAEVLTGKNRVVMHQSKITLASGEIDPRWVPSSWRHLITGLTGCKLWRKPYNDQSSELFTLQQSKVGLKLGVNEVSKVD
jgi:hypothetical protein